MAEEREGMGSYPKSSPPVDTGDFDQGSSGGG
jgi:hypothetical protein